MPTRSTIIAKHHYRGQHKRARVARDDTDVNSRDENSQTPLSCAAKEGQETVVKLLLVRDDVDVDVDVSDKNDLTLLSWAAAIGQETLTRLLLA